MTSAVVETAGLGKRYRSQWALRDCGLQIPSGTVTALVGPNGAGKTTLLHLIVGLLRASEGEIRVLGAEPGSAEALSKVAFVAQDAPLHSYLRVEAMLALAASLSPGLDESFVGERLGALGIPSRRKVGKLSGGQQAQLALALALGRRPELLVLDEPLARLDPVARHDFMGLVMAAASEGVSVLFSSHVVSELERVADHLVVLSRGRVQLAGDIEELLDRHRLLIGPAGEAEMLPPSQVVRHVPAGGRAQIVVRSDDMASISEAWLVERISLEELLLAYLREPDLVTGPEQPELASVPAPSTVSSRGA